MQKPNVSQMGGGSPLSPYPNKSFAFAGDPVSRRTRNKSEFGLLSPMAQKLSVSIVIPAYNEEAHLKACLDAIAVQTVKPFEVIVVDNNSTDNTAAIARLYPFVRLVFEPRRGLAYARNAGFNAARGEIIGRIDVDSLLTSDWVAQVQRIFNDGSVDAVSGSLGFHDAPYNSLFERIDLFFRSYMARNLERAGQQFLYGGNMAVRRALWEAIKDQLCDEREMHEDMDLAAHLADSQFKVIFIKELRAAVSVRRLDTDFISFFKYVVANPRTYGYHGLAGRRYMYPIVCLILIFHPVLRLLYRAYDPRTRRLSWSHLRRPSYRPRVSPVSESI
jgi:glycosyltransferase involved in cell wall biosynthesis